MRNHIYRLTTVLLKLNLINRFLNSFPAPDFNVKGWMGNASFK